MDVYSPIILMIPHGKYCRGDSLLLPLKVDHMHVIDWLFQKAPELLNNPSTKPLIKYCDIDCQDFDRSASLVKLKQQGARVEKVNLIKPCGVGF